jgi:hypothetical protein
VKSYKLIFPLWIGFETFCSEDVRESYSGVEVPSHTVGNWREIPRHLILTKCTTSDILDMYDRVTDTL